MEDAPMIVLGLGLGVFVVIVAPILAVRSWVRVRALERSVAALRTELASAKAGVASAPPLAKVPGAPVPAGAPAPAVASAPPATPAMPVPAPQDQAPPPAAQAAASSTRPLFPPGSPTSPAEVSPPSAGGTGLDLERLIAGRWLNRVGLLAVAVGVAFFLKAAIDNAWIGPGGQVALGLLLGAGIIASTSWFLKRGYRYFADGLTGLGGAVLYLSLWAASSYYRLIPPGAAFVAMILVTAGLIGIALGRNSGRVAALAMIGGFVTPSLVSTGQDAQTALFAYLALQNAALLVLAFRRDWRLLELPAFLFTQLYFWGWYNRFYTEAALVPTALFAALFFAEFAVLPVIRSRRHGAFRLEHGVVMLLNVTLFLVALQAMMWPEYRWTLTACTLALAAFYLTAARAVPTDELLPRLLIGGLALTLVTLAIPMRLSHRWTSMAWAIEAALLMWIGFRVRLWPIRTAAFTLFAITGLLLIEWPPGFEQTFWNDRFVVSLVTAIAAFVALWIARRHQDQIELGERAPFGALAVGANVILVFALTSQIVLSYDLRPHASFDPAERLAVGLSVSVFWTAYASTLVFLGVRFKSALLRWQGLALFGLTTLKVFFSDLADLSGFYRILSAIALGVVLLIVSFVYQRKLSVSREGGA